MGSIFFWLCPPEEAFIARQPEPEPKMSTRIQKTNTKSKQQALAAFVQKKAEIDAMLTRLQASATITSTTARTRSAGTMSARLGYYAELLKRVTDSAFNEGEHAA